MYSSILVKIILPGFSEMNGLGAAANRSLLLSKILQFNILVIFLGQSSILQNYLNTTGIIHPQTTTMFTKYHETAG